ncbi:MAG: hypothetical protein KF878_24230 [Planctomycetes bacterium]|nr:hypothetical protein [Planctomycetota bacterium]
MTGCSPVTAAGLQRLAAAPASRQVRATALVAKDRAARAALAARGCEVVAG